MGETLTRWSTKVTGECTYLDDDYGCDGELANLPLAGAKGAVGLSLYSTATVARFAPAVARAIGSKLEEWRVADKYVVVKTVVVEQAKKGFSIVASGARSSGRSSRATSRSSSGCSSRRRLAIPRRSAAKSRDCRKPG